MQLQLVYDRVNPDDYDRACKLTGDLLRIFNLISDHKPWTVERISQILHLPQTSISSHLRHLRKSRFGRFNVQRKSITKGLSYYVLMDGFYEGNKK